MSRTPTTSGKEDPSESDTPQALILRAIRRAYKDLPKHISAWKTCCNDAMPILSSLDSQLRQRNAVAQTDFQRLKVSSIHDGKVKERVIARVDLEISRLLDELGGIVKSLASLADSVGRGYARAGELCNAQPGLGFSSGTPLRPSIAELMQGLDDVQAWLRGSLLAVELETASLCSAREASAAGLAAALEISAEREAATEAILVRGKAFVLFHPKS